MATAVTPMRLDGAVEIGRPVDEVFAFVADPRNDPLWCPRVISCRQTGGQGPGPDACYEVEHNPTLQRRHTRWIDVAEWDPPRRLVTRQSDDVAEFTITYLLDPTPQGTRIQQIDEIRWRIARPFRPMARLIVGRHIGDQLGRLKTVLEQ